MKKIVAILMALAVLFSFAMAEVTPTNLSSSQKQTATATAAPTAEPAAAAEPAVVNFREALTADQLAAGTYVQVLELPLQYWVANDVFTNEEVPAEEGYEETIAILAFIANYYFHVNVIFIILAAALLGLMRTLPAHLNGKARK